MVFLQNKNLFKVAFRLDSSIDIGTGHLMRCLALAKELRNQNREVCFLTRNLEQNLNYLIAQEEGILKDQFCFNRKLHDVMIMGFISS